MERTVLLFLVMVWFGAGGLENVRFCISFSGVWGHWNGLYLDGWTHPIQRDTQIQYFTASQITRFGN
jgi:hypothetical protein